MSSVLLSVTLAACSSGNQASNQGIHQNQRDADIDGVRLDASGLESGASGKGQDAATQDVDAQPQFDGHQEDASGDDGEAREQDLCTQAPEGKVALPRDDSVHNDPAEWWYWTGHLQTDDGRWFGIELVFFRVVTMGVPGKVVDVAVTDIGAGSFHHSTHMVAGTWSPMMDGYAFSLDGQSATGGNGVDHLHGQVDNYAFDLDMRSDKAPVFQHDQGYTDYPFGGYTYYYSREHLQATGTMVVNGTLLPIHGTAWFDHQWGDIQPAVSKGWDWFALQLDDNRQIMLFVVRNGDQSVFAGGSMSNPDCVQNAIPASAVSVTPTGFWKSPHTLCTYPSGWTVVVHDEVFAVTPVLQDQELWGVPPIYWEGASTVSGSVTGRAYVELTGYCP